jgi:hypothetical protein
MKKNAKENNLTGPKNQRVNPQEDSAAKIARW